MCYANGSNSNVRAIPIEIIFMSLWGLKQKSCFQNPTNLLPWWVVAHLEIQPETEPGAGQEKQ